MRILKRGLLAVAVLLALGAAAYPFRTDPIGMLPGKSLSGAEEAWPASWAFSDEIPYAAIEVRPDDPYSVKTSCFTHEGSLYVPAGRGASKTWTRLVGDDPRVRVKLGERVFRGRATRITDPDQRRTVFSSAPGKFRRSGGAERLVAAVEAGPEAGGLDGIWLFRIDSR
jgi:hypothetical protein